MKIPILLCVALSVFAVSAGEAAPQPWQPVMAAASDAAENMIKGFKVPPDLKVELFAAEPLLAHPVSLCTDERGRFFVTETWRFADGINGGGDKDFGALDLRGHMDWLDQDLACKTPEDREAMLKRNLGDKVNRLTLQSEIVRMVWDSTGSGKADKSTIFADGFNAILDGAGAGVLARKGNVYFTCIPNLWLLNDTKGADKADARKVLKSGFGCRIAFLGHDLHGLIIGPDGKLYFSVGDRGYNVTVGGKVYDGHDRGGVFRCNQDGSEFEVFATGLRNPQELAFDAYGNLFTADNNADHGDSARWVYVAEGGDSGWRGGYQFITQPNVLGTWTSEKHWHEQHEGQPADILPPIKQIGQGPSGVAYYPGTGLPERYENRFFYCDYKGNGGIFTFSVKPKGAGFEYVEDKDKEFFWKNQATDVCFGIDGGAYASVWVSGIQKTGRGRIYRIGDPNLKHDPLVLETKKLISEGMENRTVEELAKLLEHKDMRVRQEAQFALADRELSLRAISDVLINGKNQLARLHAIWALGQIAHDAAFKGMDVEARDKNLKKAWDNKSLLVLLNVLDDPDQEVIAQAVKILGDARWSDANVFGKQLTHSSLRVRYFAALGLGKLQHADAVEPLCAMLRENADKDVFLRHAGVMALHEIAAKFPDKVLAKSADESASVRMAVLLVLRRMEDARVAQFLRDKNPLLVLEAARAINDVPIPGGFAELAKMTVAPAAPEKKVESVFKFKAEYWENVPGTKFIKDLTDFYAKHAPDSETELSAFELPTNHADKFGARISGWLTAPQSGDYTFWISADDVGQLWLSTDELPANKKLLAETKQPQWCKPREYDKYPNQKSAPVKLEAGKKYYIEALLKEDQQDDNLSVGWQLPDGTRQRPIGGSDVERQDLPAHLVRRALNANFRLGGAEQAGTLTDYAAKSDAPMALRVEALSMLGDWAAPGPRDRIMNLHRPLAARDSSHAGAALLARMDAMLKSTGKELPIAVAHAAAKLSIKGAIPALEALYLDAKRTGEVRAAALDALAELKAENIGDYVRGAVLSRDANLKKSGNAQMAKLDPKNAVATLKRALENEKVSVAEKQGAFALLGGMKSAESEAVLGAWMEKLSAGTVANELQLDVLEAARKSDAKPLKDLLAKYTAALPRDDHKAVQVSDYLAALFGGDAEAGKKIFHEHASAQCIRCHKINKDDKTGGDVGPILTGVATREKREILLEAVVDPSAKIAKGFETVMLKKNDGIVVTGILKSEDDVQIVLLPGDGKPVTVLKADVKLRKNQDESTMPPMASAMTKFELRNLIEYLSTLK